MKRFGAMPCCMAGATHDSHWFGSMSIKVQKFTNKLEGFSQISFYGKNDQRTGLSSQIIYSNYIDVVFQFAVSSWSFRLKHGGGMVDLTNLVASSLVNMFPFFSSRHESKSSIGELLIINDNWTTQGWCVPYCFRLPRSVKYRLSKSETKLTEKFILSLGRSLHGNPGNILEQFLLLDVLKQSVLQGGSVCASTCFSNASDVVALVAAKEEILKSTYCDYLIFCCDQLCRTNKVAGNVISAMVVFRYIVSIQNNLISWKTCNGFRRTLFEWWLWRNGRRRLWYD